MVLYFIDIWDDSDNIPVYPDTFSDPPELQPAEPPMITDGITNGKRKRFLLHRVLYLSGFTSHFLFRSTRGNDDKLISARPIYIVPGKITAQELCQILQQPIPFCMPLGIINILQSIHIDKQHAQLRLSGMPVKINTHSIPVFNASQAVISRCKFQLFKKTPIDHIHSHEGSHRFQQVPGIHHFIFFVIVRHQKPYELPLVI